MFDRLPEMTIITHHLGAMIPYFEGRVGPLWDQLGTRTSDEDYSGILAGMRAKGHRPIDYFRLFYNDTAVGGASSAIRCGLDFFGAGRVLFGTDCPFDPEGGPMFIRETIAAIDGLTLTLESRRRGSFSAAGPGKNAFHCRWVYPLARDKVRYVGEPVVAVLAENRYLAEDALDRISKQSFRC
jgi:hypothetical protein